MAELVIVIVEGPGAGQEFPLAGSLVAGRDPSAAIPLEDAEASRQHASITAREGGAVVEDLGSTNGTFVGDERLTGSRDVGPGDRIRIGTTVFEVREAGVAVAPEPAQAAPPPPAAPEQPAAPPPPPPAPAAQIEPLGGAPPTDYAIDVNAEYPQRIANWRPLVQWWLLVIPSLFVFYFVAIAAFFAIIAAWFAVTITGRWPAGLFNFIAGTERWGARLEAYYYLTTERYPPFSLNEEPGYPIRTRFDYPDAGIARWRPTLQWIMAIPHYIVLYVLGAVALVCAIAAGFVILFTGSYPRGLFDIVFGYVRWRTRVAGYAWFLTDRYPPFTLSS